MVEYDNKPNVTVVATTIKAMQQQSGEVMYQHAETMASRLKRQLVSILPEAIYRDVLKDLTVILKQMQVACDLQDWVQTKALFVYLRNYQPKFTPLMSDLKTARERTIKAAYPS